MIVTCSLLLVLCQISAIFAIPTDWSKYDSFPAESFRPHNTNRALSDLGSAKKCTGTKQYNLYLPSGVKFFWSGFGVDKSEDAAAEIAHYVAETEGKTCWTLETILDHPNNAHIQTCKWTEEDLACQQFWRDISCEYAKKARGDIRFILGQNVKPNGAWMGTERGQIMANRESGQDVYGFKKYDLRIVYCGEMASYPTEYPTIKKQICP